MYISGEFLTVGVCTMPSNRISPEEANARVLAGEPIVFADARNPKAWESSDRKIPGAVRVPADDVKSHLDKLDRKWTFIAYCTCPSEESSLEVARRLTEQGYNRVFVLRGGFDAWIAAGYPIETKSEAA
jgi:rhodanese-related sulfurtransferase